MKQSVVVGALIAASVAASAQNNQGGATAPVVSAAPAPPTAKNPGARKAGKAVNKQKPRATGTATPAALGARFIAPAGRPAAVTLPVAPAASAPTTAASAVPVAVFPAAKTTPHKFGKAVNKQKPRTPAPVAATPAANIALPSK